MLVKKAIHEFLDELASDSPAPGGGSVAALAGSLGAGLVSMVCRLTIGKKGYEDVQSLMEKTLSRSIELQNRLTDLIDEDTRAFNEVMSSFKLPKETSDEKEHRTQVIQTALKKAADTPLEAAKACLAVIVEAAGIVDHANSNAISDLGVASQVAFAGLDSAVMNVRINLSSIKDQKYVEDRSRQLASLLNQGDSINYRTNQQVKSKLS